MRNALPDPKGCRVLTQRAGARCSRPSAFGKTPATICHSEEPMGDSRRSHLQTSNEESL